MSYLLRPGARRTGARLTPLTSLQIPPWRGLRREWPEPRARRRARSSERGISGLPGHWCTRTESRAWRGPHGPPSCTVTCLCRRSRPGLSSWIASFAADPTDSRDHARGRPSEIGRKSLKMLW